MAIHQYEVLPSLIRLFPKVQFVVTTHSPLFVLGMNETVGENGFGIYRMPEGNLITAEEFSEFGDAYRAFATTSKFADDVKIAIQQAQSPILYMEGKTDIAYLQKAAQLLSKQDILAGVKIEDGNGSGSMTNIWKGLMSIPTMWLPERWSYFSTAIIRVRQTPKATGLNAKIRL